MKTVLPLLFLILTLMSPSLVAQSDFDKLRKFLKTTKTYEPSTLRDEYRNLAIFEHSITADEAHTRREKAAIQLKNNRFTKQIKNKTGLDGFILVKSIERNDLLRASYIYLDDKSKAGKKQADSLLLVLKKGVDFADLAKKHSKEYVSAAYGGDLGWFREKEMVEELSKAVKKHSKGDIFKVYTKDFGWLVVIVTEKAKKRVEYNLLEVEDKGTVYEIKGL